MWKRVLKHDEWLATNSPLRWLCRAHIMMPLIALLFLISTIIPFIVPIWTDFKIIIFINIFFSACILFMLYRFQFLYYDKALSLSQHFRLYLFNSLYIFLLLCFIFLGPIIMQTRIEKKLGINTDRAYDYKTSDSTDSITVADTAYNPETASILIDTQILISNPDLLSTLYINPQPDTSWLNNISNEYVIANIDLLVLAPIDTNQISVIRNYFYKTLAGNDYYEKNEIMIPSLRALNGVIDGNVWENKDYEKQAIYEKYKYELNEIVKRAVNMPPDKWAHIIKLADSLRQLYDLPLPDSNDLKGLLFTYYPLLAKKSANINDNAHFVSIKNNDFDIFVIPFLAILLINIYGIIILMSRNRLLGFSSLFIFLLITILVYSVSYISSSNGYMKYVFITAVVLAITFFIFSLLNKKIRTGILSHLFIYLLNYLIFIVSWGLMFLFYMNFIRNLVIFNSPRKHDSWFTGLLAHPSSQLATLFFFLVIFIFLNYPFIKYYYSKNIRPAK